MKMISRVFALCSVAVLSPNIAAAYPAGYERTEISTVRNNVPNWFHLTLTQKRKPLCDYDAQYRAANPPPPGTDTIEQMYPDVYPAGVTCASL